MTMTTYYAIRHRPTGFYLPGSPRGATRPVDAEPTSPIRAAPRLWDNSRNAHGALTHWLRGRLDEHADDPMARTHDGTGFVRRREDFEVVKVDVRLP